MTERRENARLRRMTFCPSGGLAPVKVWAAISGPQAGGERAT